MISKTVFTAVLIAYAEARFGQEQVPINAISQVQGGNPGEAATIAGAAISDLLGAANPCAKLQRADDIITTLGDGADAIAAAIGMVTAEKNTNPFANNNTQVVCSDPTLPATEALRGITPLIDPAVDVNGAVAALSTQTAVTPLDATGLSVFDLLVDQGFGDLVQGQDAAVGQAATGAGGNNVNQNASQNTNNNQDANQDANDNQDVNQEADNQDANENSEEEADACDAGAEEEQVANNNDQEQAAAGANEEEAGVGNATVGASASSLAGADFGLCTPTIIFEGGLGGRPADEFTFQIADEFARGGQQEALNPNIITNALCNQLTNVCEANEAAKAACLDGKAQVEALGTRDKNTADTFNAAVGFAGAVTNPSGGPENPPDAARRARRFRA